MIPPLLPYKVVFIGREPWSSDYRWRLMFWRSWVRIPAPYTRWTFRPKINKKEDGVGPLKKTIYILRNEDGGVVKIIFYSWSCLRPRIISTRRRWCQLNTSLVRQSFDRRGKCRYCQSVNPGPPGSVTKILKYFGYYFDG